MVRVQKEDQYDWSFMMQGNMGGEIGRSQVMSVVTDHGFGFILIHWKGIGEF